MSINQVALKANHEALLGSSVPFELDSLETVEYVSPSGRHSLAITSSVNKINCNDGYIYLTNRRFVFVTASLGDIASFLFLLESIPSLQFTHELKAPWFGPNYWNFKFLSSEVSDGFPLNKYFDAILKFNDGGLFDFVKKFDYLVNDVINNSHIDEELPRYES